MELINDDRKTDISKSVISFEDCYYCGSSYIVFVIVMVLMKYAHDDDEEEREEDDDEEEEQKDYCILVRSLIQNRRVRILVKPISFFFF